MLVICSIVIAVNMGSDINWLVKSDTKGKIISENSDKYLVDFTEGVKNFKVVDKNAYSRVLVNKNECVKVGN